MVSFSLNGQKKEYHGNEEISLLDYLRLAEGITSAKDGCSGQAACGACTIEINGKARLACTQKMKFLEGAVIETMEGIPAAVRDVIAGAFVNKGAVQCGFCTPGLIMRTKVLFSENTNPTRREIAKAINQNMCRCTGYVKIIDAICEALEKLRDGKTADEMPLQGGAGQPMLKYQAYETAIGKRLFVNDMQFGGMLFGALRFTDHPRAKILEIDTSEALKVEGVTGIFTAKDIPGNRYTGLIISDWPLMIGIGETTRYIGDVVAGVVAVDEATARKAAAMIRVEYEVLEPVSDVHKALEPSSPAVHPGKPNLLEKCIVRRGEPI
ncbi:MAG TPA: 2Fe-2S iron-sulfur cluster-binding protein, partial [Bacteroidales bacterium]|nr:2Fe-2S iron-sulfur cluster-binding protein [Bacteroidales bacterium]